MWLRLLLPRGGGRAELRRDGLSARRDLDWDGCANARELGEAIADDYERGAARAHTYEPALEEFLAERGTSARELVLELAGRVDLDRPALRERLLV
jgi:hypothetical protein